MSTLRGASSGTLVGLGLGLIDAGGDGLSDLVLGASCLGLDVPSGLLDLRRGSGAAHGDNADDDCDESGGDGGKTTSGFGNELDGLDGVGLCDGEEEVELLADVVDWVVHEDQVRGGTGWLVLIGLGLGLELEELLNGVLLEEGLVGKLLGILDGVANVDVVKEDIALHGPDLETDGSHRLKVGWGLVFKVAGVLDLFGSPDTLVSGIVNIRSGESSKSA